MQRNKNNGFVANTILSKEFVEQSYMPLIPSGKNYCGTNSFERSFKATMHENETGLHKKINSGIRRTKFFFKWIIRMRCKNE